MILEISSTLFVGLIAILSLFIDHIWRDKRTNTYKRIRKLLIVVIIIGSIVNIFRVVDNYEYIEGRDAKIDSLEKKVATLEYQKKTQFMLERMECLLESNYDRLQKKYPLGCYLFATNDHTIIPSDKENVQTVSVDWKNCKVLSIDEDFIFIWLSKIIYIPKDITGESIGILFDRRKDKSITPFYIGKICVNIEIVDQRKDNLVYIIGINEVDKVPKDRLEKELDNRVKPFLKSINFPEFAITERLKLNENFKHAVIREFIFTSAWNDHN